VGLSTKDRLLVRAFPVTSGLFQVV